MDMRAANQRARKDLRQVRPSLDQVVTDARANGAGLICAGNLVRPEHRAISDLSQQTNSFRRSDTSAPRIAEPICESQMLKSHCTGLLDKLPIADEVVNG